ncbi:MAG: undecaprenyl-diphosphate phosphatase [Candidatus ainarchaeum sp.]|nr:undecaprenyl-diphosphate phosphatase [Candidatus ainarchaeum sp.]
MVSLVEALFLGIVQGITEWLPISSSAHLALAEYFLSIKADVYFDLVLHLGTIVAVLVYYRKEIIELIAGVLKMDKVQLQLAFYLFIAAIPTAIIGFAFKDFFESMFSNPGAIAVALLITGAFLIIASKARERAGNDAKKSFAIGIAQGIAVAPGISRSGATIGTALLLGMKKEEAAKFSFLAGVVPILGASLLEGSKALSTSPELAPLLVGFIASAIIGYLSIGILLKILKESKLQYFGYYCIMLALIVGTLVLRGA